MLLPEFIRKSASALEALYPPQEARSLVLRLCSEALGTESYTHVVEPSYLIPEDKLGVLQEGVSRLVAGEPLQYVTGWQEFCGRRFRVTPDVLIPRPETELLVDLAVRQISPGMRVLDLCTGSGCIAWSIALEVQGAEVTAVDISPSALAVAASQFGGSAELRSRTTGAENLPLAPLTSSLPLRCACGPLPLTGRGWPGYFSPSRSFRSSAEADQSNRASAVSPRFVEADVLAVPEEFEGAPFDVLTANPPYIRESEKAAMHPNVLEHEPAMALFVPDADPLLFYRAIALWAQRFLKPGGWGIVEINEALGDQTADLFSAAGLENVKKQPDFFGKDRFVSFQKPA